MICCCVCGSDLLPVLLYDTLLVTPDYNSCCVVRAPLACGMDWIYYHQQTADNTLNQQDTVGIGRPQFTEARTCTVRGILYALEKKLTLDCHCQISSQKNMLHYIPGWKVNLSTWTYHLKGRPQ